MAKDWKFCKHTKISPHLQHWKNIENLLTIEGLVSFPAWASGSGSKPDFRSGLASFRRFGPAHRPQTGRQQVHVRAVEHLRHRAASSGTTPRPERNPDPWTRRLPGSEQALSPWPHWSALIFSCVSQVSLTAPNRDFRSRFKSRPKRCNGQY